MSEFEKWSKKGGGGGRGRGIVGYVGGGENFVVKLVGKAKKKIPQSNLGGGYF